MKCQIVQPRPPLWQRVLLASVLTGCVTTALHQSALPSPGVPMSVWTINFAGYCEPAWAEPATLCINTVHVHDGCHWRCISPVWMEP